MEQPDMNMDLPMEADGVIQGRRRLTAARKSASWTTTDVVFSQHSHDWTVRGFSQNADVRYLETDFTVKEHSAFEPVVHVYKLRLHPKGNKASNEEFSFFQIFCFSPSPAKFKAKFSVFNSQQEELQTTIYNGAQQLNGFFQYVRREDLLNHLQDDELRLSVSVTTYSDTITRQGSYSEKNDSDDVDQQDDSLIQDYAKGMFDDRFADFSLILGERKQVLKVHRFVLAARSEYFSAMLSPNTKEFETGEVTYGDIEYEEMMQLISFLYTGKTPARIRQLALELLILADRFQVTVLKKTCVRVLKEQLRVDNVCKYLIEADLHSSELKEAAVSFVVQNASTVLKSSSWELLINSYPKIVTEICIAMSKSSDEKQAYQPPSSKRFRIG